MLKMENTLKWSVRVQCTFTMSPICSFTSLISLNFPFHNNNFLQCNFRHRNRQQQQQQRQQKHQQQKRNTRECHVVVYALHIVTLLPRIIIWIWI